MKTSIALPADNFVAVVLLGQQPEGGFNDATPQPKHQVEGGLLLDVVVRQGPAVFQLLAGKYQPLLIGRDSLLVLDK